VVKVPGYNIKRQIGTGGMASVYLAVQKSLDREVALKVMSPALMADPIFSKRFQREAKTVANLTHPNIVPVYDVGVTSDQLHYFSMAYLPNGDLSDRLRAGMNELDLIRILSAIAGALGYAHKRGYIHRDVKPGNVLFDSSNNPILSDFGIARALSQATRMTGTGVSVGTSHYMSPEQARGRAVDGRTDLYSLGAVAFEALSGRPPYEGEDGFAIAYSHVFDPIPDLPDPVNHWQRFIHRALAKSSEDRFTDAFEMRKALAALDPKGRLQASTSSNPEILSPTTPLPRLKTTFGHTRFDSLLGRLNWFRTRVKGFFSQALFFLPEPARPITGLVSVFGLIALLAVLGFANVDKQSPQVAVDSSDIGNTDENVPVPGLIDAKLSDPVPEILDNTDDEQFIGLADTSDNLTVAVDKGVFEASYDQGIELEGITQKPPQIMARLEMLLTRAEDALVKDQLTTPADDNALDLYQEAKALDPLDGRAQQGLDRIVDRYLILAKRKLAESDFSTALTYIERGEAVGRESGASPVLMSGFKEQRGEILSRAYEAASSAAANGDNNTALRLFELVQRLDPADDSIRQAIDELNDPRSGKGRFRDILQSGGNGPEMIVVSLESFSIDQDGKKINYTDTKKIAVGIYEVTVGESNYFSKSRPVSCRNLESFWGASKGRTWNNPGFDQADTHPVICVDFKAATAYASWISTETGLSYRLPSEAEWEFLAKQALINEDVGICELGNIADRWLQRAFPKIKGDACEDGWTYTAPVGRYVSSINGVYDVIGNTREWVADCWNSTRMEGERDFSAILDGKCGKRVVKGTAWPHSGNEAQNFVARQGFDGDKGFNTVGFRLVRNLEPGEF